MPVDVYILTKDGTTQKYTIPLELMRGEKNEISGNARLFTLSSWPWTYPQYTFTIETALSEIEAIEIDPTLRMADVNRKNNAYPGQEGVQYNGEIKKIEKQ